MAGLTITLPKNLTAILDRLSPSSMDWVSRMSGKELAPGLRRWVGVNSPRVTGAFGRGWDLRPVPEGVVIRNKVRYAVFVLKPTRPHVITPRYKSVLSWRTFGRGPVSAFRATKAFNKFTIVRGRFGTKYKVPNFRFAMSVQHPGTKGNDMLQRMIEVKRGAIIATLYWFTKLALGEAPGGKKGA